MLRAYIDDSGTHNDSDAVVMGALIAHDETWAAFDLEWCAILKLFEVEHFHMAHCKAGADPYFWPEPKRAMLVHDLRQVILRQGIHGTSFAISRKDWDCLVTGQDRDNLGDAVEMCFGSAIGQLVQWVRQSNTGEPIAVLIDNQENRIGALQGILDNYRKLQAVYPELLTATFGAMKRITPLQGADMLAWESYQYALAWFRTGPNPAPSPHFKNFLENGFIGGAVMGRAEIEATLKAGYLALPAA